MYWEIKKLKHPGGGIGTGYLTMEFATCFESDQYNDQSHINIPGRVSWEESTNIITLAGPIPAQSSPGNEDNIGQMVMVYKATYHGVSLPTGYIWIDFEMISGSITQSITPPPYSYRLWAGMCRSMTTHNHPGYGVCSDYDGSGIPRNAFPKNNARTPSITGSYWTFIVGLFLQIRTMTVRRWIKKIADGIKNTMIAGLISYTKAAAPFFSTIFGASRKTPNCAFSQKQVSMTTKYILPAIPLFSPPKASIKR